MSEEDIAPDHGLLHEEGDGDDDGGASHGGCTNPHQHFINIALFVLGAIGNIATVLITRRPALRHRSYSPALSVLAFFNTLVLFSQAVTSMDSLLSDHYGSIEQYIGAIGCKLYRFLPTVVQLMDHWLVVFITAQRFIAIRCPNTAIGKYISDNNNSTRIFSTMFAIVAATQMWRLFLDTQEPAQYTNSTNGTLILEAPPSCTAAMLETYVDIDSFFYQLFLLFFFPALFIMVMNIGVLLKLYQDFHKRPSQRTASTTSSQRRRIQTGVEGGLSLLQVDNKMSVDSGQVAFLQEMENSTGTTPVEQRIKKATILLLAVTCTFWLYIMPHLTLLLYVRIHDFVEGRISGLYAFMRVCKALSITGILAAISCADNFVIQVIFDEHFRLELKFTMYQILGKCFSSFAFKYIRERQKYRRRIAGSQERQASKSRTLAALVNPKARPSADFSFITETTTVKDNGSSKRNSSLYQKTSV